MLVLMACLTEGGTASAVTSDLKAEVGPGFDWTPRAKGIGGYLQDEAMMRWGDATLDKLEPFLPDASRFGFTPELPNRPSDFKSWANDTMKLYPALLVHKNWYFPDPQLYREIEQTEKDKAAFKTHEDAEIAEFERTHSDEMKARQKTYDAERDAVSKHAQALIQQGKYHEASALMQTLNPFHNAAFDSLMDSLRKGSDELDSRERDLLAKRRSASFRIYTNRTPTTTAYAFPTKPTGTLVGRTLYRQVQGNNPWVNLAIFVGPTDFQNAHIKLDERRPQVKCIVVWAWLISRPDTLASDEEAAKRVLAAIDYTSVSKLIEP